VRIGPLMFLCANIGVGISVSHTPVQMFSGWQNFNERQSYYFDISSMLHEEN
jgi:hypothetical protein